MFNKLLTAYFFALNKQKKDGLKVVFFLSEFVLLKQRRSAVFLEKHRGRFVSLCRFCAYGSNILVQNFENIATKRCIVAKMNVATW